LSVFCCWFYTHFTIKIYWFYLKIFFYCHTALDAVSPYFPLSPKGIPHQVRYNTKNKHFQVELVYIRKHENLKNFINNYNYCGMSIIEKIKTIYFSNFFCIFVIKIIKNEDLIMLEWWNLLGTFEQVIAVIAILSTVILIGQVIITFLGFFDIDTDVDADVSTGSFKIFTSQGVLSFFMISSWTLLIFLRYGYFAFLSAILFSILCGIVMMVIVAFLFKLLSKLSHKGNVDISDAIYKTGTVYIPIPPLRSGNGKIQVTVSGRLCEYDAITDEGKRIETGEQITVTDIVENNVFVVIRNL